MCLYKEVKQIISWCHFTIKFKYYMIYTFQDGQKTDSSKVVSVKGI